MVHLLLRRPWNDTLMVIRGHSQSVSPLCPSRNGTFSCKLFVQFRMTFSWWHDGIISGSWAVPPLHWSCHNPVSFLLLDFASFVGRIQHTGLSVMADHWNGLVPCSCPVSTCSTLMFMRRLQVQCDYSVKMQKTVVLTMDATSEEVIGRLFHNSPKWGTPTITTIALWHTVCMLSCYLMSWL